jgi:microcin C transport system substrate-binding protein
VKNLKLLGIDATMRTVDATQYQKRLDEFDFDMTMRNMGGSLTPGDSLRSLYGSESATRSGGRNIAGIRSAAVDALIEVLSRAKSREELTVAARALDRVLRSQRSMAHAWHNDSAWLAFWDVYARPERGPRFASTASYIGVAASTWWLDAEKAKRQGL